MQAIQTKFHGPTHTKGSRIVAKCTAGTITVDYHSIEHARHEEDRHQLVAAMLQHKLGWNSDTYGGLISGQLADGTYVHVFTEGKM